jgi:hypothetical protein
MHSSTSCILGILPPQVVGVVGGHKWDTGLPMQAQDSLYDLSLL